MLVLAYAGSPEQLVGYTAGRVPFADGVAMFSPDTWQTTRPAVPVVLDGVQPQVQWTMYSDGLPMWSETLAGQGMTWTGLQVDTVAITATLGDATASQAALRRTTGVPASIELGAADFLAPIAPSLVLEVDPQAPVALHWKASGAGADATDVHVAWQTAGRPVTWDAVLPLDATSIHFPSIDDPAVTGLVEPPDAAPTARLRYIDASDLDGFDALVAAGLDLTEPSAPTIATPPQDGEIRTSEVRRGALRTAASGKVLFAPTAFCSSSRRVPPHVQRWHMPARNVRERDKTGLELLELQLGDHALVVLSVDDGPRQRVKGLTEAERQVALDALAGYSNQAIAERRARRCAPSRTSSPLCTASSACRRVQSSRPS